MLLVAYSLDWSARTELVAAPAGRAWLDATPDRFANRCLPLLIANQAGWWVLSTSHVRVTWDGTASPDGIKVEHQAGPFGYLPSSHFGSGILTWNLPYLFRTPPGWNLLARGPANLPKDGASPLEGVVETDWAVATFTMNWKLTRPGLTVEFVVGEPLCMIVPQRRGELEAWEPAVRPLEADPEAERGYRAWTTNRDEFIAGPRGRREWQKHYFRGTSPGGQSGGEHQTKLRLREFERCEA